MRYALVPHAGDWREAGVFRDGLEFNHPLICRKVLPHAGTLPARWGLLEVSSPNVVVSALKPGRDGTAVLRVYEAAGQAAPGVKIALQRRRRRGAHGESPGGPEGELKVENNAVDDRPASLSRSGRSGCGWAIAESAGRGSPARGRAERLGAAFGRPARPTQLLARPRRPAPAAGAGLRGSFSSIMAAL